MKQTLLQMVRVAAALGLLVGFTANASTFDVNELNHNTSLMDMSVYLKGQFKTEEDHRQIDADIEQLSKSVEKWSWRYEPSPQNPNHLQFRVNGRVQWTLQKAESGLPGEYSLNGKTFKLAPGKGYRATLDQAIKVLKSSSKQAQFSLINEAEALFPLAAPIWAALGFAVTAGAAHAESRAMGAGRTFNCTIVAPSSPSASDHRNFRRGGMCDGYQRHFRSNANARIRAVRNNFCNPVLDGRRGSPHSCNRAFNGTMSSNREFEVACVPNYAGTYGPEGAIAMCKCIRRKTNGCAFGGWNMSDELAAVTCRAAYDSAYCRGAPAPVYAPPAQAPGPGYLGPQTPGVTPKTTGYTPTPPPAAPPAYEPPGGYQPPAPPASSRD